MTLANRSKRHKSSDSKSPVAPFAALVKDLRAAGVPYEPDLFTPFLVRQWAALYVALGTLCKREEEYTPLGGRVIDELRWIESVGRRSRFAHWFKDRW